MRAPCGFFFPFLFPFGVSLFRFLPGWCAKVTEPSLQACACLLRTPFLPPLLLPSSPSPHVAAGLPSFPLFFFLSLLSHFLFFLSFCFLFVFVFFFLSFCLFVLPCFPLILVSSDFSFFSHLLLFSFFSSSLFHSLILVPPSKSKPLEAPAGK